MAKSDTNQTKKAAANLTAVFFANDIYHFNLNADFKLLIALVTAL